jgi:hypothetical protein
MPFGGARTKIILTYSTGRKLGAGILSLEGQLKDALIYRY